MKVSKHYVLRKAKEAGFTFWDQESWKPEGANIDWSSSYDNELMKFAELILEDRVEQFLSSRKTILEEISQYTTEHQFMEKRQNFYDMARVVDIALREFRSRLENNIYETLEDGSHRVLADLLDIAIEEVESRNYSEKYTREFKVNDELWIATLLILSVDHDDIIEEYDFSVEKLK